MANALIGLDKSGSFRVCLAVTTAMVEAARQIHDTTPLATAGLGRALTGAGLMGLQLKNPREKLTLHFKGDGPALQILATARGDGRVKGYVANPRVDLPLTETGKLDVGGSLGIAELTVMKDMGLREPYVGRIALTTGEIADDLTAYLYISEQQNASVALGVKVGRDHRVLAAGGMILYMLPGFREEAVNALEEMLATMPPLTAIIEEAMLADPGQSEEALTENVLHRIFAGMAEEYRVDALEYREVEWECDCSRQRLEQTLMTLGISELEAILEEDGEAELVCQFCTSRYHFDYEDLTKLLEGLR